MPCSMLSSSSVRRVLLCAAVFVLTPAMAVSASVIEEVVVTGRLQQLPINAIAASVSVVAAQRILDRQAEQLEQLLNVAPNVNYNAGASRGRFVQIRGIGERSQFVDPVDPSVGLYIDGIDFSGLGNAGTLFDVDQVEILRGPQGTAFGASAMAGLVNIRSAAPTEKFESYVQGRMAEYGTATLGAVISGPLGADAGARLALHHHQSDGYIRNSYLGRDDTSNIAESTARVRIDWQPGDDLQLGLTALHIDADNGYDAFSLDNNRHTLSDQPGQDRQQSDAVALRGVWGGARAFSVEALATWSASDLDYGYDEDWSYPAMCPGTPCEGWEYASTDRYLRDVMARSLDVRLVGQPDAALQWVAGVYAARRDTELDRRFFDFSAGMYPPPAARFASDYESTHVAAYAELSRTFGAHLRAIGGLRVERLEADYADSLAIDARPAETLWGGQISVQYEFSGDAMLYALVARGYKAGGVNGEAIGKARQAELAPSFIAFLQNRLEYNSETLYNYELGYKALLAEGALQLRAALFYMDRRDVQLKAWYNEGPLFVGYTDNAASGSNYGIELESDWAASERLHFSAALGLLATQIDDFIANDPDRGFVDKSGREQAQAPAWQFNMAAELALFPHTYARAELEGKDRYYFSDSDDQRSDAFQLLHLTLGFRGDRIEASAWVRNALDEKYAVHGFYFGNDPRRFYINEPYYQFGEPRVAGVSLRYTL